MAQFYPRSGVSGHLLRVRRMGMLPVTVVPSGVPAAADPRRRCGFPSPRWLARRIVREVVLAQQARRLDVEAMIHPQHEPPGVVLVGDEVHDLGVQIRRAPDPRPVQRPALTACWPLMLMLETEGAATVRCLRPPWTSPTCGQHGRTAWLACRGRRSRGRRRCPRHLPLSSSVVVVPARRCCPSSWSCRAGPPQRRRARR